jgi:hypothetical protein
MKPSKFILSAVVVAMFTGGVFAQETKTDVMRAQSNLDAAKSNEQSMGNRLMGAGTMAATGAGGQLLLAGMAEGRADDEWGARIENITASITCRISGATVPAIPVGESGMTPMRSRTSVELRDEYLTLARATRETKEELGLPPGIESDAIIDMRDTYAGNQVRVGNELDLQTAAERRDGNQNQNRVMMGAGLAVTGIAGGLTGNHLIK